MKDPQQASNIRSRKTVLTALAVIFLAPVIVSWALFSFTDVGRNQEKYGHGVLINPPRKLPDMMLTDPANPRAGQRLYGKWNIVYLASGACGSECDNGLYTMRQLRLAVGREAHRLRRVLIVFNPADQALSGEQLNRYSGQLTAKAGEGLLQAFKLTEAERPVNLQRLYIIDPLGNLMMCYPEGTDPAGIIKDLKRLLKFSRIG